MLCEWGRVGCDEMLFNLQELKYLFLHIDRTDRLVDIAQVQHVEFCVCICVFVCYARAFCVIGGQWVVKRTQAHEMKILDW